MILMTEVIFLDNDEAPGSLMSHWVSSHQPMRSSSLVTGPALSELFTLGRNLTTNLRSPGYKPLPLPLSPQSLTSLVHSSVTRSSSSPHFDFQCMINQTRCRSEYILLVFLLLSPPSTVPTL